MSLDRAVQIFYELFETYTVRLIFVHPDTQLLC